MTNVSETPDTRAEVLSRLSADDGELTILDQALFTANSLNGGVKVTVERHDTRDIDGKADTPQYLVTFAPINKGGHEADIDANRIPDLILQLAQLHWSYKKMQALDRLFDGKNVPAAENVIVESKRSGVPAGELFDSLVARARP